MNTTTQLALTSGTLLVPTVLLVRSALRFTAELDRRRPPVHPRPIKAGVAHGSPLPQALMQTTVNRAMRTWPAKAAILLLGSGCAPCDELEPEVTAAIRDYRDFTFFIDGWAARKRYPRNLVILRSNSAARELGLSVSPSIVIALNGVVDSVFLVNAGGQIEAALTAANRRYGGAA